MPPRIVRNVSSMSISATASPVPSNVVAKMFPPGSLRYVGNAKVVDPDVPD